MNDLVRRAVSLSEPVLVEESYASEPPGLPTQEGDRLGPAESYPLGVPLCGFFNIEELSWAP